MPTDYNLEAQLAYLSWIASEDADDERMIRVARDYAAGKHPVFLSDRQKEFIGLQGRDTTHLFAHNMCALILDCLVERLQVDGFKAALDADAETGDDLATRVQMWWEYNRMDAGQDDLYSQAARDGSAYIIVDWDAANGMPVWAVNAAFDGDSGVRVYTDPSSGALRFAAKRWQVSDPFNRANNGRTRLTLYFQDRIEKYISIKGANKGIGGTIWEQWRDSAAEPWPIPWADAQGPLGLAVIPFNNPGGSEIEQLIHLQDALNKTDVDMIATTDTAGFRILYASGVGSNTDPATGKEKKLELSPGHLLRITDPQGRLGSIEPTDPALIIRAAKYWIECMAGLSRTPQYLFQSMGADQPSGESLKEQEIGLIYKAERRQRLWGNAWEDVIALSARLHNMATPNDPVAIVRMSAQWKAASAPADPIAKRLAEGTARKAQVESGMPFVAALKEEGKTETEIAAIMAEQDKIKAGETAALAQAMLNAQRQFDQGLNAGPEIGGATANG